jgi:hypothetical protein
MAVPELFSNNSLCDIRKTAQKKLMAAKPLMGLKNYPRYI